MLIACSRRVTAMADASPLIFNGPVHSAAISDAKQMACDWSIDLDQVRVIVGQRVAFWEAKARGNPKCGADLMGLLACRAVLDLIAGETPEHGDGQAWLSCTERRGLAAIDSESAVSLRAPTRSPLAGDHPYLLSACRLLRCDGLFRAGEASKSVRRRAAAKKSSTVGRKAA
jgi:hypothetical protein